jgi:hypothetical protein
VPEAHAQVELLDQVKKRQLMQSASKSKT